MNIKRLKIMIATICALFALGLIGYGVYSFINNRQKTAEIAGVKTFSENFIRDYATYKVAAPDIYNAKIATYISPSYRDSFLDKYELGPIKSLDKADMADYSTYLYSRVDITSGANPNSYNVVISYTSKVLDAGLSASPTEENNKVELTVIKEGGKYYISTFGYVE